MQWKGLPVWVWLGVIGIPSFIIGCVIEWLIRTMMFS